MSGIKKEQIALFVLRVSLGAFLLISGIGKLIDPEHAVRIFAHFYKLPIAPEVAVALGIFEVSLSLLILIGAWKRYSYGLGVAVHFVSVASSWRMLLDPFAHPNDLFVAGVPVLAAFILLYLLRDRDVLWAVGR